MKTAAPSSIGHRIKKLMQRQNMTDAELARQINTPQATVSRILAGITQDPRVSTMSAIAAVLGTTIDHLVSGDTSTVPLLEWHEIADFLKGESEALQYDDWLTLSKPLASGSFAVQATPSLEPYYRNGAVLIVEPAKHYRDFQIVIVSLDQGEPTLRRLIKDGSEVFLEKVVDKTTASSVRLSPRDMILGAVVEVRMKP